MSTHRNIDRICIVVLVLTLLLTVAFMNGEDRFGQTGKPAELMALYGLDAAHIAGKVREIVK